MSKGRMKALAALTINLSAGWFGLALVTPIITENSFMQMFNFIKAFAWGLLLFEISAKIETRLGVIK